MTDLNPEIWNNPTLGSVGAGPFLPEIELQQQEDRNARLEGREPKLVEYVHRYPKMMESGSVPSIRNDVEFKDFTPPVAEFNFSSDYE